MDEKQLTGTFKEKKATLKKMIDENNPDTELLLITALGDDVRGISIANHWIFPSLSVRCVIRPIGRLGRRCRVDL